MTLTDPRSSRRRTPLTVVVSLLLGVVLQGCAAKAPPAAKDRRAEGTSRPPAASDGKVDEARFEQLLVELAGDHDSEMKAVDELVKMGAPIVTRLVARLDDPRWFFRWRIVNTLGYMRDPRALEPLVDRVLRDPEVHVRWRALWAAGATDLDGTRARELYFRSVKDPDPNVAWQAVLGLAFMKDRRAIPPLHTAVENVQGFGLFEAVFSLMDLHDGQTSSVLERFLAKGMDPRSRKQAALVLGRVCDEKSRDVLVRVLDDHDWEVRLRVVMALDECEGPGTREALEKRQATETQTQVKTAIEKALGGRPAPR